MQKVAGFKSLPRCQVSDDLLWGINKKNNCFLRHSHGLTVSVDPTNLSGLNYKRDAGVNSQEGIGISLNIAERRVKERKAKKRAPVVRFDLNIRSRRQLSKKKLVVIPAKKVPTTNNRVYSAQKGLTARSIIKAIRGIKNYRPDLQRLALQKLRRLHIAKNIGKVLNKRDAKRQK
jgi:hypothetical protein